MQIPGNLVELKVANLVLYQTIALDDDNRYFERWNYSAAHELDSAIVICSRYFGATDICYVVTFRAIGWLESSWFKNDT